MTVTGIIGTGLLLAVTGCACYALGALILRLPRTAFVRGAYYFPALEVLVALAFCLLAVRPGCTQPLATGVLLWHCARFAQLCIAGVISNKALAKTTKSSWTPLLYTTVAGIAAQLVDYLIVRFIIF